MVCQNTLTCIWLTEPSIKEGPPGIEMHLRISEEGVEYKSKAVYYISLGQWDCILAASSLPSRRIDIVCVRNIKD